MFFERENINTIRVESDLFYIDDETVAAYPLVTVLFRCACNNMLRLALHCKPKAVLPDRWINVVSLKLTRLYVDLKGFCDIYFVEGDLCDCLEVFLLNQEYLSLEV